MKIKGIILILSAIWVPNPVSSVSAGSLSLASWSYTAYQVDYSSEWTAKLTRFVLPNDFYGYSTAENSTGLICRNMNGRTEISSPDLNLKPFTWYGVEIAYQTDGEADSLITMAGLYPDSSRYLMDVVVLPPTYGEIATIHVQLHTGLSEGPYHFFLGNTGTGSSTFHKFQFQELDAFIRPSGNLMVVDLLKLKPDASNLEVWRSARKFTHLFGFTEPDYLHPLEATLSEIEKSDPDLIVLSPTAVDTEEITLGKKDIKKHSKGIGTIIGYAEEHRIPVLGICAGHQAVAQHYGAFLARLRDDQSGNYLSEIGPTRLNLIQEDPIFEGLQGNKTARIIEAHMIVVGYNFELPENLAVSKDFGNQIFRYDHVTGIPWYTFQGHIEKDWEYACPESSVIFNNMLNIWGFTQPR